jgi:histidine ammonia-lyase
MMMIRAKTLAMGYSGVRLELVEALVDMLNSGLVPAVPEHGSLGASGDLAPLAHVGLCLCGEGWALEDGKAVPAAEALRRAGLKTAKLEAKEGLSLINGTDGMLGMLILALDDLRMLLDTADLTTAMAVEALLGTDRVFAEELHSLRPHPGQVASARNIRRLLEGSPIVASHQFSGHLVQDAYSLRCTPQVYGAARDTLDFAAQVARRELASTTDNPVVLPDGRVESTGNFHGEPLGYALDALAMAMTGVANISERRTYWLLGPGAGRDLPPFLSPQPGLGSGLMLAQYTQAALVSECKVLAGPASLDSIPTSGTQEDHVSMGWLAGLKLRQILDHVATVTGAEALVAGQALDLRRPLRPAAGTGAALTALRDRVPALEEDRDLSVDIAAAGALVRGGALADAAGGAVGGLA